MNDPTGPAAPSQPVRRCIRCAYVLDHIAGRGACPECGAPYDLADPATFTRKPPFVRYAFWLPGALMALGSGAALDLLLIPAFGYGWATTLAVPCVVGVVLGYRVRARPVALVALVLLLVAALVATLLTVNLAGGLCVLVLGALALAPALLGMILGVALRRSLKNSTFSQRGHLPVLFAAVTLLAALEGRHRGMAVVSTSTVAVVNATPEQTWHAIQFYEQVKHRPPLLLWVSPSLRPVYTTGASEHVGDRRVCVYARGRLVKEITEAVPGERLAFRVVEQTDVEDDGVRLVDGRFDLSPTPDGLGTVVTLTTRYEPKLAPRFAYRPAEDLTVHTLHGHVLRGMREDAERPATRPGGR